ncbi:MAG: DNA polymerase III DnaE [uncultured bacterium]|nr:MAG: DNA polymerase III DnaE [uncultured bacterium]
MKTQSNFVHLHVHTMYGLSDSIIRVKELLLKAKEFKMASIAITDTSVMFGAYYFYKECKKLEIKPIIGAKVFIGAKSNKRNEIKTDFLILLVKNEAGYRNLCKIVSDSERIKSKLIITKELLTKHTNGLICLNGGLDGELASLIFQDKIKDAILLVKFYQSIFGIDNYYLKISDHGLKQERELNKIIIDISKETSASLVATNDCHYLNREDALANEVRKCISSKKILGDINKIKINSEYYFKSDEEMEVLFKNTPEAISNTLKIAERCNFDFGLLSKKNMPRFKTPNNISEEEYFLKLCKEGMKGKVDSNSPEVRERFEYEFSLIKKYESISFFLIYSDIFNFAKTNDIPITPLRSGLLVAYLLGISNVNPIKYDLELISDKTERYSLIIEVGRSHWDAVAEYISRIYGKKTVAYTISFNVLKLKSYFRNAGRLLSISSEVINRVIQMTGDIRRYSEWTKYSIPPNVKRSTNKDKEINKSFEIALKLENIPKNVSNDPFMIISKCNLTDLVPLYKCKNKKIIIQFDKSECERLGLLVLGYTSGYWEELLNEKITSKKSFKPEICTIKKYVNIPMNDPKTYALLNNADTSGVFLLESSRMKKIIKKLGVQKFSDIILLAASRPLVLTYYYNYYIKEIIKRKHGRIKVEYLHPLMEGILKETYGMMFYLEQIIKIAKVIANFTYEEANTLLRAINEYDEVVLKQLKFTFIEGAIKNKIYAIIAEKIYDKMSAHFLRYQLFDKAECIEKALLIYQSAWMKANQVKESDLNLKMNHSV